MKKQILLLSTLFVSALAIAQQPSFGIEAGVVSSSMRGDAVNSLQNIIDYTNGMVTTSNRTGFYAGGRVNIPVSANISIEPGLRYAQKGYQLNGDLGIKGMDFLGAGANAKLTSHYIDLPLLLKGNFNGFEIFAGPQVSYLVKSELKTTAGILGFNLLNKNLDATDQFKQWDAAVTGGVGYQFTNGFSVRASYDHGLSRIDANGNMNAYNSAFKVGVGMKF